MKLHEYQAKDLLRRRGVFTLDSQVCFTLEEAYQAVKNIGLPAVIKAQVHAGGRGKAGGIKLVKNEQEAHEYAEKILSMTITNEQTGENGQKVSCILIEKAAPIKKEIYFGMLVDRQKAKICIIASSEGGADIEEVAAKNPSSIKKIWFDKTIGLMPYQLRKLMVELGIDNKIKQQFVSLAMSVYRAFVELDADLIEINPLCVTDDNRVIALDAKMLIDENALYRQPKISEMRDPTQEDEKEIEAQHHKLSYVSLDGNIGCMVNGAGLAMATMDIIKYAGGKPANFLDVGGSATQEAVQEALKIIVSDKNVRAIFVNVFGGIAHCDVIAQGVVNAAKSINLKLPLIARLEGTNVDKGRSILSESGLNIIPADDMLDGAKKAVARANA